MHLNEFADPKIYALPADGVPRVSNGDVDWESQTDVAHFYPDVVGDFIDRLSNDVALCVECIVCRRVVLMFDGVHMVFLQGVGYLSSLA